MRVVVLCMIVAVAMIGCSKGQQTLRSMKQAPKTTATVMIKNSYKYEMFFRLRQERSYLDSNRNVAWATLFWPSGKSFRLESGQSGAISINCIAGQYVYIGSSRHDDSYSYGPGGFMCDPNGTFTFDLNYGIAAEDRSGVLCPAGLVAYDRVCLTPAAVKQESDKKFEEDMRVAASADRGRAVDAALEGLEPSVASMSDQDPAYEYELRYKKLVRLSYPKCDRWWAPKFATRTEKTSIQLDRVDTSLVQLSRASAPNQSLLTLTCGEKYQTCVSSAVSDCDHEFLGAKYDYSGAITLQLPTAGAEKLAEVIRSFPPVLN